MLGLIIKVSIVSIIFIFIVHNLLVFFKSTLTVPKIKDLVNSPTQKYQNIYDTISNSHHSHSYTEIDLLPSEEQTNNNMKDELKSFLKRQLNKDTTEVESILPDNIGNYSEF